MYEKKKKNRRRETGIKVGDRNSSDGKNGVINTKEKYCKWNGEGDCERSRVRKNRGEGNEEVKHRTWQERKPDRIVVGDKKAKDFRRCQRWRTEYRAYLALCSATVWPRLLLFIQDQSTKKACEKHWGRDYTLTEVLVLPEWMKDFLSHSTTIIWLWSHFISWYTNKT